MTAIPREASLDSALALLAEGYTFISKRCGRLQSDVFKTRFMLRNAICAMGEDAAAMFYHPDRFTRKHAVPPTTLLLLRMPAVPEVRPSPGIVDTGISGNP